MVVGCGESQPPEPTTAKAPDIPIHKAVGTGDPDGALIQAAKDGNIEAAKQAINDGADVNAKADWGGTPLCDAAYRGHKEIVELLIAEGADLEAMDIFEDTPLDQAIKKKHTETADLLRKHGGKTYEELKVAESIYAAIELGNIEVVKQHLAAGADVNAKKQGGLGETPLHYAAKERRTEIVKLLINKGANVNAIGDGRTPLRHLIGSAGPVKETEAISKLLRKHGGKER